MGNPAEPYLQPKVYGQIDVCPHCGANMPQVGKHVCDPSYQLMRDVIEQAKLSHGWMFRSILHTERLLGMNSHSDELKHAEMVEDSLERMKWPKKKKT